MVFILCIILLTPIKNSTRTYQLTTRQKDTKTPTLQLDQYPHKGKIISRFIILFTWTWYEHGTNMVRTKPPPKVFCFTEATSKQSALQSNTLFCYVAGVHYSCIKQRFNLRCKPCS